MKIALVGLLHNPIAEPFAGGMESHTWWLAKKLIERGHDVSLFASGDSDPTLGLVPCNVSARAIHTLEQTPEERYNHSRTAYSAIIDQLKHSDFDVVHNNALYPFLLPSAADLPMPMLTVLHAPPYPQLAKAVARAISHDRSRRLAIIAVSKSLADEWQPIATVPVVYNGIDVDSWPFSSKAPLNKALWFGRIVPEKGAHIAIRAALMAGYEISVAGPVSDVYYFEDKVAPLLKHDRVHYLGHLSHSEIKQVLTKSSVLVNTPLWEEPYGIVYAEALASGTPVAAFERGAVGEILTKQCGVTVKEESVEKLARAIQVAATLSRQDCRRRAESFCNINHMIDSYEYLYEQLAQRQHLLGLQRAVATI